MFLNFFPCVYVIRFVLMMNSFTLQTVTLCHTVSLLFYGYYKMDFPWCFLNYSASTSKTFVSEMINFGIGVSFAFFVV